MSYAFRSLSNTTTKNISEILNIKEIVKIEERCREAERDIKEIREHLFKQVQLLQELQVEKCIKVVRRKQYRGNIEIYVYLEESFKLGDYKKTCSVYSTSKKFTGLEKKKALEYAIQLQKSNNNIKIVKENWK